MVLIMALKRACTGKHAVIFKPQLAVLIWINNCHVKIDQISCILDPVGVVTGCTRRLLAHNMAAVFRKTLIRKN